MKQKILILLAVLMTAVSTYAYDFSYTYNGKTLYFKRTSANTCALTYCSGYEYIGDIIIPSVVPYYETNYYVTSIGTYAFGYCASLTSVDIPTSVISIENSAFDHCTNLTSIQIPNSVTSINSSAFNWCPNLKSINIPDSVTLISDGTFNGCAALTKIEIPNSVLSIGDGAFRGCTGLTSIVIPNSVTSIGKEAFSRCSNLISFIGKFASQDNRCLVLNGELVAFAPAGLKTYITPSSVTSIGSYAFSNCTNLTSIVISNSVLSIGASAFSGCTALTSLDLPNSVTSIGDYAFNWCSGLTTINIPNSVTSISGNAFAYCSGLTSIEIPNSVISIGDCAFYKCSSLTSIEIPNTIVSIGYCAFEGCTNLTSLELPDKITTIEGRTFKNCSSLSSIKIPNSVLSIGESAFSGCSSLLSIVIPNSVSSIEGCAFCGCSSLSSIKIPNSVLSIGASAFSGCSSLLSIVIPNSVTVIKDGVFSSCSNLASIELPKSVTTIGEGIFNGCKGLKTIKVNAANPNDITVKSYTFYGFDKTKCDLYVPTGSTSLYASVSIWSNFQNIIELSKTVSLVDSEAYTETVGQDNVDVVYNRTFTAAVWQPLYVPFNMSYDEWKDYGSVAEVSCVHAYEDGRTTIEFVTVTSGELLPNVPYVFKPNTGDEITFTCTNKTLKAAPAEGSKYIICCSPRYTFKIYGNYQPISGSTLATYGDPEFKGAYVMTTNNKFQHCSSTSTLKPYRFYFTREKTDNGYWGAPARQNAPTEVDWEDDVIYLVVDGEICGIVDILTDTDSNGAIYDLMGREVKNPSNGIYIQNGKKIFIY